MIIETVRKHELISGFKCDHHRVWTTCSTFGDKTGIEDPTADCIIFLGEDDAQMRGSDVLWQNQKWVIVAVDAQRLDDEMHFVFELGPIV
jgi:hypothetical protein